MSSEPQSEASGRAGRKVGFAALGAMLAWFLSTPLVLTLCEPPAVFKVIAVCAWLAGLLLSGYAVVTAVRAGRGLLALLGVLPALLCAGALAAAAAGAAWYVEPTPREGCTEASPAPVPAPAPAPSP